MMWNPLSSWCLLNLAFIGLTSVSKIFSYQTHISDFGNNKRDRFDILKTLQACSLNKNCLISVFSSAASVNWVSDNKCLILFISFSLCTNWHFVSLFTNNMVFFFQHYCSSSLKDKLICSQHTCCFLLFTNSLFVCC